MADLPVMLKVEGRRCVIVGGGKVALRRAEALVAAGARVTVISPRMETGLAGLAAAGVGVDGVGGGVGVVELIERGYEAGDVAGAFVVVTAADKAAVNETAAAQARAAGALVNRADEAGAGDWRVPAHERHGPITVAVDTGGISASAGAAIRRELSAALDPDWARLLEVVGPWRGRLQGACADAERRSALLRRLAEPGMLAMLKREGRGAVGRCCERLLAEAEKAADADVGAGGGEG